MCIVAAVRNVYQCFHVSEYIRSSFASVDQRILGWEDIFGICLWYAVFAVGMVAATYLFMLLLSAAHMMTVRSWLMGIAAPGAWGLCYEVMGALNLRYALNRSELTIQQGPGLLSFPLDGIASAEALEGKRIPWAVRLGRTDVFVLGFRFSTTYLRLKRHAQSPRGRPFMEVIYLTPDDAAGFQRQVQQAVQAAQTAA